jgi:hypothetical protein
MSIPAHFEFHYVQNGVKHSVTLFTATLFNKIPLPGVLPPAPRPAAANQQRPG